MFITSSAALTPDTIMYDSVFPTVEIDLMEGMDNMAVELGLTPDRPGTPGLLPLDPDRVARVVGHLGVPGTTDLALRVLTTPPAAG